VWLNRGSEAVPVLEKKLEEDPYCVDVLQSLARSHGSAGTFERAVQLIDRAIDLRPNSGILFFDKGQILARANRNEEALDAVEQAAALFSPEEHQAAAIERARLLVKMKRFPEALEALDPFLAKGQLVPGIFSIYGAALGNEDRSSEALEYFNKATNAFENDSVSWGNKGILLCNLGKYEEALNALDRSLALNPTQKRLPYFRCDALLKTNQHALAVESSTPEDLSHNLLHRLITIANLAPKQGDLQQQLSELESAHDSEGWRNAFVGGLTEFANLVASSDEKENIDGLQIWNSALRELFAGQQRFSILLNLFDVLTRVKVFNDRKSLLELPREQRLLLVGEKREHDLLNSK